MAYKVIHGKVVHVPGQSHPRGRVSRSDEGECAMEVFADPSKGVVVINWPKPVHWMALEPDKVDEFIKLLELNKAKLG